jgi:type II secretory pathway predicted ATPase ExeA
MSIAELVRVACWELENCVVLYPRFREALEGLERLVTQTEFSGLPFGASVIGESGSGKTTLMKALIKRLPSLDLLGERSMALCVSAHSCPTIGDLLIKMARELGFPVALRGNRISDLSVNLFAALRERETRALFVQDFQHLYRGSRDKLAAAITDWIKHLVEETGIVIVMFGTPELGDLGQLNMQLQTRAPARYRLCPFVRGDEWIEFLKQISARATSLDWSPIYKEFERELFVATCGLPRPLMQMLSLAARSLVEAEERTPTWRTLDAAHQALFGGDPGIVSPFAGRRK